jgi:hypothetical protein
VTANDRNALVRAFGQQNQDYLLVLTSDFEALEFVLIEKVQHQRKGPGGRFDYQAASQSLCRASALAGDHAADSSAAHVHDG